MSAGADGAVDLSLGPSGGGTAPLVVRELQRAWVLAVLPDVAWRCGAESMTVNALARAAGLSRRRFYQLFGGLADCLAAGFEEWADCGVERVQLACAGERTWLGQVRVGVSELLAFFDEEPKSARLYLRDGAALSPVIAKRQGELIADLVELLERGRGETGGEVLPLTAESLVGGALAVVNRRLRDDDGRPLSPLRGPLLAVITQPFIGLQAARMEVARSGPYLVRGERRWRARPPQALGVRVTHRTLGVLATIARRPGISNRELAAAVGMRDEAQMSRLLARLESRGVVYRGTSASSSSRANAWRIAPTVPDLAAILNLPLASAAPPALNGARPPAGGR